MPLSKSITKKHSDQRREFLSQVNYHDMQNKKPEPVYRVVTIDGQEVEVGISLTNFARKYGRAARAYRLHKQ